MSGYNAALHDARLMEEKKADEEKLRQQLAAMKDGGDVSTAWTEIGKAMQVNREIYLPLQLLERSQGFNSELAGFARTLVRAAAEKGKPNTARLREFRETALPSLEQRLFSPAPIYDDLEILLLTDSLTDMQKRLGADNEVVKRVLAGRTPADAAKALIAGTKLKDVAERQRLYKGGAEAIAASDDPLIAVMRGIDQEARAARQRYEDEVDAVVRRESARIAQGRFKLYGLNLYPDATFTLRLSYGAVSGYVEDGRGSVAKKGAKVPICTDIAGLFARSKMKGNKDPWELPPTWIKAESKVNKKTAMDCAATTDSIGGNSGSPMVDRAGELVGINFDRNAQGLGRNFVYTEVGGRNVFVDARGILEALRTVYSATPLADELSGDANK